MKSGSVTSIDNILKDFSSIKTPELTNPRELKEIIDKFFILVQKFLENKSSNPFYREESAAAVNQLFNLPVPQEENTWESLWQFLNDVVIPRMPSVGNPHFFGYVPSDPSPAAMVGAMMTPFFNQFVGTVVGSPGGTALESLAIKWIIEMLNYDKNAWGCFTSGGSSANLTCMYTGILSKLPWDVKQDGLHGNKHILVYISDQAHNSIIKSLLLMGLGYNNIRIVETDTNYRLTAEDTRKIIEEDKKNPNNLPVLLIGTAGTTNTGAIDDLKALADLAKQENLWFHIDGAYGAFAKLTNLSIASQLSSLEQADSLALDAHKWLYTSFEAGLALVKDRARLIFAFDLSAEYLSETELEEDFPLQRNYRSYGFPLTRELRGLKIWFNIKKYGKSGLESFITRNILLAYYLGEKVTLHPKLELLAPVTLSIVCFRWKESNQFNEDLIMFIQRRQDFFISRTFLKGKTAIRCCILNLQTSPNIINDFLDEVILIGSKLENKELLMDHKITNKHY